MLWHSEDSGAVEKYMKKETYKQFLLSEKWLSFRKEVFAIFNYECWFCKSKKILNVHHLRYNRRTLLKTKTLTKNNLRWFMVLCSKCHKGVHKFKEESGLELYRATQKFRSINFPGTKRWITKKQIKERLELLELGRS